MIADGESAVHPETMPQDDVLSPCPQRGYLDGHDVQSIVEIFPETALGSHGVEGRFVAAMIRTSEVRV